jgi:hypothetical protein
MGYAISIFLGILEYVFVLIVRGYFSCNMGTIETGDAATRKGMD